MNVKTRNAWKALLAIILLIVLSTTASARLADNDRDAIVYEAMYALRESNTNGQFAGNVNSNWSYIASDKDAYEIIKNRLKSYSSVWTDKRSKENSFYSHIDNYSCYDGIGRGGQCLYFANLLAYRSKADTNGFNSYINMEKNIKNVSFARPGDVIFTRNEWKNSKIDHTAVVVMIKEGDSDAGTVTSLHVVDSNWCAGGTCEIIKCHILKGTTLAKYKIYTGVPYYKPVIQIIDQSVSPTTAKTGDELTFVYNISNPYSDKVPKIRLGAQVRTNDPQGEWIDNMGNDKVKDIASGANDYSRLFKLPLDSKPGFYDARWVLINESTKKPTNSKEMIRIFEVQKEETSQPKLDLILLVDTTGSMWDDIANVKASAGEIVNALDSEGIDYRVAVADYRDYPEYPYGKPEVDYVYNLNLPFTAKDDRQDIIDAINGLTLGSGWDWRESVYSALVMSMTDISKDLSRADNHGWRKGVTKVIIIMADAPPHDPEPWTGGYNLSDVTYWSENIDPVMVYSVVIGNDPTTYAAFSEISEKTGGKAYLSPTADDVANAIIKAIKDINTGGISVEITPTWNEASPGNSVFYSVNITNNGNLADVYDISLETENIAGSYRGYPLAIQYSWITFNNSTMEIDPSISEIRPLAINVPGNWAGMEDVTYIFNVSARLETNKSVSNTSSAELKVRANKRSMIEYSKLEIQWLSELVDSSTIDHGIKNALLAKLAKRRIKSGQSDSQFGQRRSKSCQQYASNIAKRDERFCQSG